MPKVVGVRFHGTGKSYHFDPGEFSLQKGDAVIVETKQGIELGIVADEIREIAAERLHAPLKNVLRIADLADLDRFAENSQREKEAFQTCLEKIEKRGLEMRLVDVEYAFDRKKVIFYFTADGRVDFRELVKDLAAVYHARIELRQIAVRDEARMICGMGICGRELCCCSYLTDFVPVSIKMAKTQSLSMNPAKISGTCGRLMCCLKYEHDAYEDAQRRLPRQGTLVMTEEGPGCIINVNLLKETATVLLNQAGVGDTNLVTVPCADLEEIEGGCAVLESKEQPEKAKTVQERPAGRQEQAVAAKPDQQPGQKSSRRRSGRRSSSRRRRRPAAKAPAADPARGKEKQAGQSS